MTTNTKHTPWEVARCNTCGSANVALNSIEQERDRLLAENAELRAALTETVAYIEMRLAHNGALTVDQIIKRLREDVPQISMIDTSHHLGCNETTRRVDLVKARAALARAKE